MSICVQVESAGKFVCCEQKSNVLTDRMEPQTWVDQSWQCTRVSSVASVSTVWDSTDYQWRETPATKLAMLFGLDQADSQGDQSFQYTAPRQPRGNPAQPGPPSQTSAPPHKAPAVLFAVAVHAFRYEGGQYVKLGKIGAAVVGSHMTKEYKVLLYGNQHKEVHTSARLQPGFVFTVQSGNYAHFYDDEQQYWSVMFESEKARADFCKQVCLAKWNSTPCLDVVVLQDLALGEGWAAEHGDSLEVSYTGWLMEDHAVGQVFDSTLGRRRPKRLRLGAGKVVEGLEKGMLGLQRGARRYLVVPPGLGYSSQAVPNLVPTGSTLIFEVEVHRVMSSLPSATSRTASLKGLGAQALIAWAPHSPGCETSPECRTAGPNSQSAPALPAPVSLSELSKDPGVTEVELTSCEGRSMLSLITNKISNKTSSSDTGAMDPRIFKGERCHIGDAMLPSPSPPVTSHPPATVPDHSVAPLSVAKDSVSCSHPAVGVSQYHVGHEVYSTETPYPVHDITSFLMTDARQHHAEIQLAVGKVADKIALLTSKVDNLKKQGGLLLGTSAISMDTPRLLQNIQRIVQENEDLKRTVSESNSRITEQNMKIGQLTLESQRYLEQNILLLNQRNNSVRSGSEQDQACLLRSERDKVWLTEELAASSTHLLQLQQEAMSQMQKGAELEAKLSAVLLASESHVTRLVSLERQVKELKEGAELIRAQHCSERWKHKGAELRVCQLEKELRELVDKKVKSVMNCVFHTLRAEFDLQEMYDGRTLLEIIAHTIKNVTLQILADTEVSWERAEQYSEEGEDVLEESPSELEAEVPERRKEKEGHWEREDCVQVMDSQIHQSDGERDVTPDDQTHYQELTGDVDGKNSQNMIIGAAKLEQLQDGIGAVHMEQDATSGQLQLQDFTKAELCSQSQAQDLTECVAEEPEAASSESSEEDLEVIGLTELEEGGPHDQESPYPAKPKSTPVPERELPERQQTR